MEIWECCLQLCSIQIAIKSQRIEFIFWFLRYFDWEYGVMKMARKSRVYMQDHRTLIYCTTSPPPHKINHLAINNVTFSARKKNCGCRLFWVFRRYKTLNNRVYIRTTCIMGFYQEDNITFKKKSSDKVRDEVISPLFMWGETRETLHPVIVVLMMMIRVFYYSFTFLFWGRHNNDVVSQVNAQNLLQISCYLRTSYEKLNSALQF